MKKNHRQFQIFGFTAIAILGIGLAASVVGMAQSVNEFRQTEISHTPEAILASAGVERGSSISLPVTYYDQRQDPCVNMYDASQQDSLRSRQFEWTTCNYHQEQLEPGLFSYDLDKNYLPTGIGGKLLSNRGLSDNSRWFSSVEGKSKEYAGSLNLTYKSQGEAVEFVYTNNDFYPLDSVDFSQADATSSDGHNHLFTMSLAIPFNVRADGGEAFKITADDDTFVYVGDKLALDMGGIHGATIGQFTVNESGEVYTSVDSQDSAFSGIKLERDTPAVIRIFHADRDSVDSIFRLKISGMTLNIVQSQLAGDNNGVQIAYDPSDPGYVGPLGESTVIRPDSTKGQIIIATVLGVVIVVSAFFIVILARSLVKSHIAQNTSTAESNQQIKPNGKK